MRTPTERSPAQPFSYTRNEAVLHADPVMMPSEENLRWSSWNYLGHTDDHSEATVSYWMNKLQPLATQTQLFVTLNPPSRIQLQGEITRQIYDHPLFDGAALAAQDQLWSLQGARNTWFCGAYFGHGFHEDGLQSGLAVAEQLGGVRRPWSVQSRDPVAYRWWLKCAGKSPDDRLRDLSRRGQHRRLLPKAHFLRYRVFQLYIDLDEAAEMADGPQLFGFNRPALLAFYEKDHGDGSDRVLKGQITARVAAAGLASGGAVRALCMPRVLGYVFNPITHYFVHDAAGALAAVVHEVNNTIGGRCFYVLPASGGGAIEQQAEKRMYVSPFMDMDYAYDFALTEPDERFDLTIHMKRGDELWLTAGFAGQRRAFSDRELLLAFAAPSC